MLEVYECEVCIDCIMFIANGDLSGLDNDPDTADERQEAILAGVEREADAGGHWVAGDGETVFSRASCDCCDSSLAGSRHGANVIYSGNDGEVYSA